MASLYQRFTGKINTNNSFPHPPEASRLLGGQAPEEENKAGKSPHHPSSRPPAQYRNRNACEEEDVRSALLFSLRGYFALQSLRLSFISFKLCICSKPMLF
uniref:Uncharacterized protein n=1 Tax=Cyprinus carpio TaxID=7962 RepID=A0A8C1LUS0_CYPCA